MHGASFIYVCANASDAKCFPLPQADEGWFSKRARKINHTRGIMSALTSYWYCVPHDLPCRSGKLNDGSLLYPPPHRSAKPAIIDIVIDESRNILYTLSARGAIEVFVPNPTG